MTISINPDTPTPDCVIVNASQRLRVVNATYAFHQRGSVITVAFAGLAARAVARGQSTTFGEAFGHYLAPDQHVLQVSAYPGSRIIVWLK